MSEKCSEAISGLKDSLENLDTIVKELDDLIKEVDVEIEAGLERKELLGSERRAVCAAWTAIKTMLQELKKLKEEG